MSSAEALKKSVKLADVMNSSGTGAIA